MSRSGLSLFRVVVCGALLAFGPEVAAAPVFILADYVPLDPGNTWDHEITLNSVPQGITRTTVLWQTKRVGGTETRILERSEDGSQNFLTNDAAGLRQHGVFTPGSGTEPDSSLVFAPPLALADSVVEAGDVFESGGSAVFKFRGLGIVTGSYSQRSTVFGIESISVPLRAEPFEALRIDMILEISLAIPGGPSMLISATDTDWYGLGIGLLRSIEELDGEIYEGNLVATNVPEPPAFCDDGLDNDGDGFTDFVGGDPGCADPDDLSENDPTLPCDDGADNDGDGGIDFDPVTHADPGDQYTLPAGSGDPGCFNPSWFTENPKCQDGAHNDGDGQMDYDAGLSANGSADSAGPDSHCVGQPWVDVECGLGAELAFLLPPLMWLNRRRSIR